MVFFVFYKFSRFATNHCEIKEPFFTKKTRKISIPEVELKTKDFWKFFKIKYFLVMFCFCTFAQLSRNIWKPLIKVLHFSQLYLVYLLFFKMSESSHWSLFRFLRILDFFFEKKVQKHKKGVWIKEWIWC